jgi:hypothetical protein
MKAVAVVAVVLVAAGVGAALAANETVVVPANGTPVDAKTLIDVGTKVTISGTLTYKEPRQCVTDAFWTVCTDVSDPRPNSSEVLVAKTKTNPTWKPVAAALGFRRPEYQSSHVYRVTTGPTGEATFCVMCGRGASPFGGGSLTVEIEGETPDTNTKPVTITAVAIVEDVSVRTGTGPWEDLSAGRTLKAGDEIHTGAESRVVLNFSDGTRVSVPPLSQLKIATLVSRTDRVQIDLLLKIGELNAKVKRQETPRTDFGVRIPSLAHASVRGTAFSVFADARATVVSVTQHAVVVDPKKRGLRTKTVTAGKEVEVTATAISRLAPIGKARARGGINRVTAFHLVERDIDRAADSCGIETPRNASAFSVKPAAAGWRVTVNVTGKLRGASSWSVRGGKAKPANGLAKSIAAGCG